MQIYQLLLSKNVTKFFIQCSAQHKKNIKKKLELLKQNPYAHPELDIKPMKGYPSCYRLRIGTYRLIYKIREKEQIISIFKAGYRGDIYKKL